MKMAVEMAVWDQIYLELVVFLVCMLIDFSKKFNRCRGQDFLPPKAVLALLQCVTFIILSAGIHYYVFYSFVQCGCRNYCPVASAQ